MSFFNFELKKDATVKTSIKIPKKLAEKLPEDYLEFLKHYVNVEAKNSMDDNIYIKIEGENVGVYLLSYNSIEYNDDPFPKCYVSIAEDCQFEGFILSLRKEDFGHVYYMDLEMWQEHILGLEDEKEIIESINKNSIHIANSFTGFTQSLFLISRKR